MGPQRVYHVPGLAPSQRCSKREAHGWQGSLGAHHTRECCSLQALGALRWNLPLNLLPHVLGPLPSVDWSVGVCVWGGCFLSVGGFQVPSLSLNTSSLPFFSTRLAHL